MGIDKSGIPLNAAIAVVLTRHRKDLRLTYEILVGMTGIPLRTLKRIFTDERPMDTAQLEKVSRALGVTMSQVVSEALAELEKHDRI
jgi:transcriptional regulator with XRE-family HTH domain